MSANYYAIFRVRGDTQKTENPQPPGTKVFWWKPGWTNIFPPHHQTARIFIFWLMSRLHVFSSADYAVLIIEDSGGRLLHRTFCIPAWWQFPFMRRNDIQLGDVYTVPGARKQGLGEFAIRLCIDRFRKSNTYIYYVAQSSNLPSHRLALKSGLSFFAIAMKRPTKTVGYYSLIYNTSDYSLISQIVDPRYSQAQLARSIEHSLGRLPPVLSGAEAPMRILAVIPFSASPTSMIFARRQMAALSARGHTVDVFELNNRRSIRTLLGAIKEYRRRLRTFRPDAIHAHYGAMTSFFSVYGALGLAPVVITFRGSDLNPVPSMPLWQVVPSHILSNLSALGAAHLICVSAELRRRLWWGKDKAALIPTGVDTTKFFPGSRSAERAALGWSDETPVVLFNAGHSPPVKRLDLAHQVVALARQSIPALKFVVLKGEVEPDEVPKLMRASDCLLFTSDFEGSPTVIQEAMACNLPIVSVIVGDVPERLQQVTHSYVLERNPAQLAEVLVKVLRARYRSNGSEIAQRELGNEPIAHAVEKVYEYVCEVG